MRVQGWDPILQVQYTTYDGYLLTSRRIICQIISLQAIHYLVLSTLIPPFVATLTSPDTLDYSGGPSTVSHIMDWREMAALPTINRGNFPGVEGWRKLRGAWAGGKQIGSVKDEYGDGKSDKEEMWDYGVDKKRGWVIGSTWLLAFAIDIAPLYYIVQRPTHILDFALTLIFNHFILTTYYSASFPTSFFFWLIQVLGAVLMVVSAEALCVRREMKSELEIGFAPNPEEGLSLMENQMMVPEAGPSRPRPEIIELTKR
nr:hypothetical protein L203_00668 [Cryptococcus depauperatus CBS 7841]